MSATNGQGYEVQAYDRFSGWRRASKVMPTIEQDRAAMAAWPVKGVDLRVYESLELPCAAPAA